MLETRVTVVETRAFFGRAKGRMSAAEVDRAIEVIARDPLCGNLIQGTGGIRKVRFAVKGRGKSGGVRIVYCPYPVKAGSRLRRAGLHPTPHSLLGTIGPKRLWAAAHKARPIGRRPCVNRIGTIHGLAGAPRRGPCRPRAAPA